MQEDSDEASDSARISMYQQNTCQLKSRKVTGGLQITALI